MATVTCAMLGGHPGQLVDELPSEKKRYVPRSEALGHMGYMAGANRTWRLEDGRIAASFRIDDKAIPVVYSNEKEAVRAFVGLRKDQAKAAKMEADALDLAKPIERTVDYSQLDPTLRIDQIAHGEIPAQLGDPETFITGAARLSVAEIIPVRSWLKVAGPYGQELASMFERKSQIQDIMQARHALEVERILAPLTPDEIATGMFAMAERGAPAREEVRTAWRQLNALLDKHYSDAKALGISVADRIENYFPHVHNMRRFTDPEYFEQVKEAMIAAGKSPEDTANILSHSVLGKDKTEAIQDIMNAHRSAGNQLTEAEAASIFERFVQQRTHFVSGHLERERISSIPPIEDARLAYTVAGAKNAHRLAEAQTFGASYEKAYAVMDALKHDEAGGKRAFGLARKAFDLEVGRLQDRMPPWAEALYDWQAAKLSLSVLANLTQTPINLPVRVGGKAYWAGLADFVRAPGDAKEHAKAVGAIVHNALDQIQLHGLQELMPREGQTLLGKVATGIKDFSLHAFNLVETMNRSVAVLAGEHYFDQQIAALARNAGDTLALRRLQEMGFRSQRILDDIVAHARTPNDGLMPDYRALAGKYISDTTQFKSRVADRPIWFSQSAVGKMLYQYKQFSVGQTEFMVNNLFAYKRGDTARTLRTVGLIFTAFPAIAGAAAQFRGLLTGDNPTTKSIDQFFESPGVGTALMAGIAAIGTTGTLGIVGDIAGTALLGNSYAVDAFGVAPSLSSAINVVSASSSVIKGIAGGDLEQFEKAARVAKREFGGFGGVAIHHTLGEATPGREATGLQGLSGLEGLKGL